MVKIRRSGNRQSNQYSYGPSCNHTLGSPISKTKSSPWTCNMVQLLDLPSELVSHISSHVTYPDSLSLKHTCKYFQHTIDTNVRDRVSWLLERTKLGLPIPHAQKCNLKTDAGFCSSPEVRQILRNRRKHIECSLHGQGRCLLLRTTACPSLVAARAELNVQRTSLRLLPGFGVEEILLFLQANVYTLVALFLSMLLYKP